MTKKIKITKNNMRILITGGSGFLGQYLNIELSKENDILTLYNNHQGNCSNFPNKKININNSENLKEIFDTFSPEIVVNTAAVSTPQEAASLSTKEVYETNVNTTKKIAEFCNEFKAKLIFTSTDLVYAGYRGSMLKEDSKLIPVSLYAETKLMGEVKIQEISNNYLILRMALMYGFGMNNSKSHFDHMYSNFKTGKKVKLFYDQFRTPLSVLEAVRIINNLCKLPLKNEIINIGGRDRLSRLELGEKLCEHAGFDKSLIEKTSMKDIPDLPQVADVSLNTDKLQSYGIKLQNVDDAMKEILLNN